MPKSSPREVRLLNNKWTTVEKFWMKAWPRYEEYYIHSNAGVYWRWYSDALPYYMEGKFSRDNVRLFIPGGVHCQIQMRSEKNSTVIVR